MEEKLGKTLRIACFLLLVSVGVLSIENEESGVEEGSLKEVSLKMSDNLVRLEFEVFGTVQGVFFRKYTQQEANKLGLRGFCRNTSNGTVSGTLEGSRKSVEQMKVWLEKQGSPMSTISKAVFKNEKVIDDYSFKTGFEIARTV